MVHSECLRTHIHANYAFRNANDCLVYVWWKWNQYIILVYPTNHFILHFQWSIPLASWCIDYVQHNVFCDAVRLNIINFHMWIYQMNRTKLSCLFDEYSKVTPKIQKLCYDTFLRIVMHLRPEQSMKVIIEKLSTIRINKILSTIRINKINLTKCMVHVNKWDRKSQTSKLHVVNFADMKGVVFVSHAESICLCVSAFVVLTKRLSANGNLPNCIPNV